MITITGIIRYRRPMDAAHSPGFIPNMPTSTMRSSAQFAISHTIPVTIASRVYRVPRTGKPR